jgi:cation diffusion facilitator family transporter
MTAQDNVAQNSAAHGNVAHNNADAGIKDLYRDSRRAALGGLLLTLGLGTAKLVGGWFGHSLALLSDSIHSFGDALASATILGALVWAERPPDREHPYGHTRVEAISALTVALLLVLSGLWVGWEAIHTWGEPAPTPHGYTVVVALVSVLLNEALYRYSSRVAHRTGSKAVLASAWDQRMDAFGSFIVLVGLCIATWGGPAWHAADHITALAVSAIIVWTGGHLFWSSMQELMDRQAEPEILDLIRREALTVPGVRDVEKLFVRKSGLEYLADIHVCVDPDISVKDGHAISHAVKSHLLERVVTLKSVLVHIEPA